MKTRTVERTWARLASLIIVANGPAYAQTAPGPDPQLSPSIEQDLLTRLKGQPIGQGTLESVDVPDEFLRRVADRIIRMDYQKRYRMVLRSDVAHADSSSHTAEPTTAPGSTPTTSSHEYPMSIRTLFGVSGGAGLVILIAVVARRRRRKDRG